MSLFKRWKPAPLPASPIATRLARVRAERELADVRRQRAEVDRVAEGLHQLLKRNGFGEAIEQAMRRRGEG